MKINLKNIYRKSPKIIESMYKTYEYTIKENYFISDILNKIPLNNQITFLTYPAEELLYGGMAGGGKSEALLLGALQYVEEKHIPNDENKLTYDALILRRTLDDLEMPNAILDRAKQWLLPLEDSGLVRYRDLRKQFRFSSGATLTFRYLAHNNDLNKYQGAEFQYIGFDELTQFHENQYNYLHSRLRKTENNQLPLRMMSASNPGGVGHNWVKAKFIKGNVPFVPSSYLENIYLNQEEYGKQLDKLDTLTKQQLKYGDWDTELQTGLLLDREHLNKALISYDEYKNWKPELNVIGIDKASTGEDKFAVTSLTGFENGKLVLTNMFSTTDSFPEEYVLEFIEEEYEKYNTYLVNFEGEPGSDSLYALRHWQRVLEPLSTKYGIIIDDTKPITNKFNRARPIAMSVKEGELLFDNRLQLNDLFNQFVYIHPNKEVLKDYPSPDELDSLGYAFAPLKELLGSYVTAH